MDVPHATGFPTQKLFEFSVDMLGTATLDGYFNLLNPAWTTTLGWPIETLMAEPYINFVHPDDVATTLEKAASLAQFDSSDVIAFENRYRTLTGDYRWLDWSVFPSDDLLYFVVHDITLQHERQETLRYQESALLESQDFLNGLVNSITEGIYVINHDGRVTYINAAAQKMLGWSEEEVLGKVMHEISHFEKLDGTDMSIDECPILQTRMRGATLRVERDVFICRDGTRLPVSYTSSPLNLRGAFGSVVVFDDITQRLATEMKSERELDKIAWIGRIQDAMRADRFVLYAQSIMNLRTQEVQQHELLLRMKDLDDSIIEPGRFLPAAEEFGLIRDIDQWVIRQSAQLASEGHKVEFNLSARSLELSTVNTIAEAIRATGARPENLVCEITETSLMNDSHLGEIFVKGVRDLGCEIALDDFGVSYGGLLYLKRLPVSYLKIDEQFVADLVEMETSRHVVRAIVDLARSFGAHTIAEGAENAETLDILKELGVDFAQGFFIDRPRPLNESLRKT